VVLYSENKLGIISYRQLNCMVYSNYIIYVDESGDHSLKIIDKEYPLFVLTFCLVSKTDYQVRIIPQVVDFKHRWFGHEAVILHAHDIRKEGRLQVPIR